jgi:ubiquinone/menaquinone biosynthesis C-methylase UbiE
MTDENHNRDIYNSIAHEYHLKRQDPKHAAWNNFLEVPAMKRLLKPLVTGASVLDLGCGSGILSKQIISWGANVTGVDQSEMMLNIAKKDILDAEFYLADTSNLPLDDGQFDVVASSLVMPCSSIPVVLGYGVFSRIRCFSSSCL